MQIFRRATTSALPLLGVLVADALSKTNPIFTKILFGEGWTPLSVYFISLLFIVILLSLHEFMDTNKRGRWTIDRQDIFGILLTTLTGGLLSPLLFMWGLQTVQASEAVVITSIGPLFIVIFAVWFLGESFSKDTIFGGLLLLSGSLVLLWRDLLQFQISFGVGVIFLAAIFGAITTILHKKFVHHRHLDSLVYIRAVVSLGVVAVLVALFEPESFALIQDPPGVWTVLGLSALSYIVPYFLYFKAIRNIRSSDAGIVLTAGPVVGVVLAYFFLGEAITTEHLLSLALIALGIIFINVPLTKWRIMPSRLLGIGPLRR